MKRDRLPPLEWIRAFEAAARLGSFTAAAEDVGLTQAAVSQRIGQLEKHLGTPLFNRRARAISLTVEGEAWVPHELTEDDLVDLLDSCHVDAFRRPGLRWLGRAELRTMLQLWLSPRAMIEADEWPRFLAKGLSDIQTSRAVRYVALRRKLALLDMPDGSPM